MLYTFVGVQNKKNPSDRLSVVYLLAGVTQEEGITVRIRSNCKRLQLWSGYIIFNLSFLWAYEGLLGVLSVVVFVTVSVAVWMKCQCRCCVVVCRFYLQQIVKNIYYVTKKEQRNGIKRVWSSYCHSWLYTFNRHRAKTTIWPLV